MARSSIIRQQTTLVSSYVSAHAHIGLMRFCTLIPVVPNGFPCACLKYRTYGGGTKTASYFCLTVKRMGKCVDCWIGARDGLVFRQMSTRSTNVNWVVALPCPAAPASLGELTGPLAASISWGWGCARVKDYFDFIKWKVTFNLLQWVDF